MLMPPYKHEKYTTVPSNMPKRSLCLSSVLAWLICHRKGRRRGRTLARCRWFSSFFTEGWWLRLLGTFLALGKGGCGRSLGVSSPQLRFQSPYNCALPLCRLIHTDIPPFLSQATCTVSRTTTTNRQEYFSLKAARYPPNYLPTILVHPRSSALARPHFHTG